MKKLFILNSDWYLITCDIFDTISIINPVINIVKKVFCRFVKGIKYSAIKTPKEKINPQIINELIWFDAFFFTFFSRGSLIYKFF